MTTAAVLAAALASVVPLARVPDPENTPIALAGQTALLVRADGDAVRVLAVPVDGSARAAVRLSVPVGGSGQNAGYVLGSPTRAAIEVIGQDEDTGKPFTQEFAGPPVGPWPALAAPRPLTDGNDIPLLIDLDGDRLFAAQSTTETNRAYTVREGDGPATPIALPDGIGFASFAGDLAAYLDSPRLIVRNWRTGAESDVELPEELDEIDLRADGAIVAGTADGAIDYMDPGGPLRRIASHGEHPVFAGDRVIYAARTSLMAVDPGGAPRRIGVPSMTLESFAAAAGRVVYTANGCLFAADPAAPPATSPDAGVCARTETYVEPFKDLHVRHDRRVTVRVECVAAPGSCRGRARLAMSGHGFSEAVRFAIPQGATEAVRLRLSPRLYRAAKRVKLRPSFGVAVTTIDPDGKRNTQDTSVYATVG
jgi:hypothetical protein